MSSQRKLTINEMKDIIEEAYQKNPSQNLGFIGTPGTGKTAGVYQAVDNLRKVYGPEFFCKVIIASQMESVDFRLPFVTSDDKFKFIPSEDFNFPWDAKGIIFFDEAANGALDVLKMLQQCMSDRKLGEIKFGPGIMFVIASNNKEDRAGANSIPTSFANRIEWHQVDADYEGWLEWAYGHKIDVALTSFISKFPDSLNKFKADKSINPTPRSWAKIHDVLGSKFEYDRCCGLIGEELATKFMAWRKLWTQFPDKKDIEVAPEKAKLPTTNDAQFALTCAICSWADIKNWPAMCNYMSRLNLEYQTLFMKEATRISPEAGFKGTKEYRDWIVKNQDKLL